MFQTVKALKGIALSALLLEEFINGNKVSA